jgi:peptidoglycan/LPS O-acetylase OafA/YrhL
MAYNSMIVMLSLLLAWASQRAIEAPFLKMGKTVLGERRRRQLALAMATETHPTSVMSRHDQK